MLRNGGVEDNPGYELVVHPPLGKQLIALGELAFGYDGVGWRAAAALAGTLTVLLVVRAGRRLTRSTMLGGVAGRAADLRRALARAVPDGDAGRVLGAVRGGRVRHPALRPRRRAGPDGAWSCARAGSATPGTAPAGRALVAAGHRGAARAGLRGQVVRGVLAGRVRGAAGVLGPHRAAGGRGASGRCAAPWCATWARRCGRWPWCRCWPTCRCWWAWFGSETAIDRHVVGNEIGTGGAWAFLPDALRGLWYYSGKVLAFHAGLTTESSGVHPWESKPWTWPMGLRPMLYHYASGEEITGCGATSCVSAVMLIGTPALWWPAVPVLGFALWRAVTRVDWRYGAVLVGYGGGHRARGSSTWTARCTSSTWPRWRRSWCWPRCW